MSDNPVAVWQQLEGLRGQDLIDWRVSDVKNHASLEERNLDKLPLPFGWFMVAYSDEVEVGDVKAALLFRARPGFMAR